VRSPGDVEAVTSIADDIEVTVGDVADPAVLRRLFADAKGASVVHTAGVIHPRKVAEFAPTNIAGTRAVVDVAADVGVGRMVHVSSNSPFGLNGSPHDRFRNDEPYRPYLGYGQSKMEAEIIVRQAGEAGAIDAVIVRPPWFYGPHQPERQTAFFRLVRGGRFPLFGRGENRRSMVYTENLVLGIALAERTVGVANRAYWVADPEPYAMSEVVETVTRALADEGLSVSARQVRLPAALGMMAMRSDAMLQRLGVYQQELHVLGELSATIACDVSAAQKELGYAPAVTLYEGMRRSIRWCLDQGITL
jgi:nucleoside-diphosphate-sugar epimerase